MVGFSTSTTFFAASTAFFATSTAFFVDSCGDGGIVVASAAAAAAAIRVDAFILVLVAVGGGVYKGFDFREEDTFLVPPPNGEYEFGFEEDAFLVSASMYDPPSPSVLALGAMASISYVDRTDCVYNTIKGIRIFEEFS
jgi:hypothetical protein